MESPHLKLDTQKPVLYGVEQPHMHLDAGLSVPNLTTEDLPLIGNQKLMKDNLVENVPMENIKCQLPKLKLEMEMFADLSGFCEERKPVVVADLPQTVDELNTPVFEIKAPFDYDRQLNSTGLQTFTTDEDQFDFKIKCELPTLNLEDNTEDSIVFKDDDLCKLMSESFNAQNNNSLVLSSNHKCGKAQSMLTTNAYSPFNGYGDLYLNANTIIPRYDDEQLSNFLNNNNCNNLVMDNELFPPYETPDTSDTSRNSSPETKPNLPLITRSESIESVDKSFNILSYVNSEELKLAEPVLQTLDAPSQEFNQLPRSKRKRIEDDDPNDEDYIPSFAKRPIGRRKRSKYISDSEEEDEEFTPPKKPARRGRPPKRLPSCSSDDYIGGDSRYREMRDKNNEASRKSRMKRKYKENALEEEANYLAERNIKLKAQVTELEKTVANFRQDLIVVMSRK